MQRGQLSRRGFVQSAIATLGAAGIPNWYAAGAVSAVEAVAAERKDDSALRFGCIGIGSQHSRGSAIYNDARTQTAHKTQFLACCDVDASHVGRAVGRMQAHGFKAVTAYHDFRDLNDRNDIDAVLIATPDHWHTLIAIDAMKKGKDVYCEKPLTLTIEEALAIQKVAKKTGRVLATGSQQRSDHRFRMACELVRNGRIGQVKTVECRIGNNPVSGPIAKKAVPEEFDYNFWLGPAPMAEYVIDDKHARCHYEFRWWYEYSGGKMTDWGAHHLDIAQWALGKDGSGPIAVEVLKSTSPSQDPNEYNTHPEFHVEYTYEEGTKVIAMHGDGTGPHRLVDKDGNAPRNRDGSEFQVGPSENGVLFVGTEGTIFVSRSTILASDAKLLAEPLSQGAVKLEVSPNHMVNFLDCIKSRKKPICSVDVGASSVMICHLGTIALRSGKKLRWDPVKHQFNDAEANAMLSRKMRESWKLDA